MSISEKQNDQLVAMQRKSDYYDALVDRNMLTNIRDTAKELEVGQNQFIRWLLKKRFLYRDQGKELRPYGKYVPELFKLKEFNRNRKTGVQPLITPKGKGTFRLLMEKEFD